MCIHIHTYIEREIYVCIIYIYIYIYIHIMYLSAAESSKLSTLISSPPLLLPVEPFEDRTLLCMIII